MSFHRIGVFLLGLGTLFLLFPENGARAEVTAEENASTEESVQRMTHAVEQHPLFLYILNLRQSSQLDRNSLLKFQAKVRAYTDANGRVTPELQEVLYAIEDRFRAEFDLSAACVFQSIIAEIGAKQAAPIDLPENQNSFWQNETRVLKDYLSHFELPETADIVIIGAGLTGTSAAYHLREAAKTGKRIVLLEASYPASQSSGKNGGNFELMPENFSGIYEGLLRERYKFLKVTRPAMNENQLKEEAFRQAKIIFEFCQRNCDRFAKIIAQHSIQCDFSPKGWLRIAMTAKEEVGIFEEVELAKNFGIQLELWSPQKIQKVLKIPAQYSGRLAPQNGNYHPVKFVNEVLKLALQDGIQLYTNTQVSQVLPLENGRVEIQSSRGTLRADRVIVATNAFTTQLFPELTGIRPYQSQIMNLEHVQDNLKGMTVTEIQGDLYYNFPASTRYSDGSGQSRGMVHLGGGLDRPVENVNDLKISKEIFNTMKAATDERFPETQGQPPSRLWTGPMAFTEDRIPVIGFLNRGGEEVSQIIIAAGFNGYGGSFCLEAGHLAAEMALTSQTPVEIPADVFSPKRLMPN